MKNTVELKEAVKRLDGTADYKLVIAVVQDYRDELNTILINTKADIYVAQGMVRAIDQVLKKIVKT